MEQSNCLSRTPFFHCIFVVLSGLAPAFPTLAVDLPVKDPSAHNYPRRKKIAVVCLSMPGPLHR